MTEQEREKWLAERKTGIGGSETAALLGKNPYMTPMKLWLQKTGRLDPPTETDAMKMGTMLEPIIVGMFLDDHPEYMAKECGLLRHPKYPEVIGTPDRLLQPLDKGTPPAVLEAKAPGFRQIVHWGENAEHIPPRHVIQTSQYMLLAELVVFKVPVPLGFVKAVIGGQDKREYHFDRDKEMDEIIIDTIREFWHNHVLADKEPDLDATAETSQWLVQKFGKPSGEVRTLTPQEREYRAVLEFKEIDERLDRLKEEHGIMANALKSIIGEDRGVAGDFGQVLWSYVKDSESVSYKSVLEEILRAHPELAVAVDKIVREHTKPKAASRRFSATWAAKGGE